MTRIERKRRNMYKTYDELANIFYSLGDDHFCSPLSVCFLTGISPQRSIKLFEKFGRKKREGTINSVLIEALTSLGYDHIIYDGRRKLRKYRTPRTLEGNIPKDKLYIIQSCNHSSPVMNGEFLENDKGKLWRVEYIIEISKKKD